jgi:hypothetical protein
MRVFIVSNLAMAHRVTSASQLPPAEGGFEVRRAVPP